MTSRRNDAGGLAARVALLEARDVAREACLAELKARFAALEILSVKREAREAEREATVARPAAEFGPKPSARAGSPVDLPIANEQCSSPRSEGVDWVELKVAAVRWGRCRETTQNAVKEHGLGWKLGGRWMVDMVRFRAWRDGRPYERLPSRDG